MKSLNTTEAGVFAACYDISKQLVDGGPGWTCEEKCYTPDDFVDEIMLNCDLGLYLDFTVNQTTGRQLGYGRDGSTTCPGLAEAKWASGRVRGATEANCAKGPHSHLVEMYAADQATWVEDFGRVFDKMTTNGYDRDALDLADYGCCKRSPPSKAKEAKQGSTVECDPRAVC